jgi:hypothetical protein
MVIVTMRGMVGEKGEVGGKNRVAALLGGRI